MAYPTLKFFPAFSTSSQLGILRTGTKKVDNIRQSMITFVENQFKEKAAAHHWPILSLLGLVYCNYIIQLINLLISFNILETRLLSNCLLIILITKP